MERRSSGIIALKLAVSMLMALAGGYAAIWLFFYISSGKVSEFEFWYPLGVLFSIVVLVLGLIATGVNVQRLADDRAWPTAHRRLTILAPTSVLALIVMYGFLAFVNPLTAGHLRIQWWAGRRDFRGAKIEQAALRGANLSEADLSRADLREADLRGANLRGANLSEADLSDADLSDADLHGVWLGRANLRGANLIGADLRQAWLKTLYLDSTTRIDPKWHLVWEIHEKGGTNRDLQGVDLSGAWLDGADLSGANLQGADLSGAFLWSAHLDGANLASANLAGGLLFDADLSGADLHVANLGRADLLRADLSGADLSGATVTDRQLSQAASLEGATMPDGSVHE